MSRSSKTAEPKRYWVGKDPQPPEVTTHQELHWYEAYKLGYRATKWNKADIDVDDTRYDLKEKEEQE